MVREPQIIYRQSSRGRVMDQEHHAIRHRTVAGEDQPAAARLQCKPVRHSAAAARTLLMMRVLRCFRCIVNLQGA
jgi:hypothetical protein